MRGTPKKAIHSDSLCVVTAKLKAVEHIQPDSVLLHCKLFLQRRHRQRTEGSLCRRGTNNSTRPARRKWYKNKALKYNKDTEGLITADNSRILSYTNVCGNEKPGEVASVGRNTLRKLLFYMYCSKYIERRARFQSRYKRMISMLVPYRTRPRLYYARNPGTGGRV